MRRLFIAISAASIFGFSPASHAQPGRLQFVFTSDAHYGISRPAFRGGENVDAHVVNAALVARIDQLPFATFPKDGGIGGNAVVGAIDFLVEGGDIANRSEVAAADAKIQIQSATTSWAQFSEDYLQGLSTRSGNGDPTAVYVVPGNHDASNAVGFYKEMSPPTDSRAMVEIYNRMVSPKVPKTVGTFVYARDRVLASRDVNGVHLIFLNVWPDSVGRAWMERDLAKVPASTPVVIFTHDQPDCESKHFINPNGAHDVNATDMFENLLADALADGSSISSPDVREQAALEAFVLKHHNIAAYFHGNSNWNQFYDWTGPAHRVILHTFRVDSPMKGAVSGKDETKLSFQVATIDLASMTMTVRECLWNADPKHPAAPLAWGGSTTVAFPR